MILINEMVIKMDSKIYDKLIRIITPYYNAAIEFSKQIGGYNYNKDMLALAQQLYIKMGNVLENDFRLIDTPVIRMLEQCCEDLFKLSQMNVDQFYEFRDEYISHIAVLPECLDKSIGIKSDNKLAITAVIKNEAPYIREWIEYHRIVGVDHFYIYDNGSTDDIRNVLEPYIRQGIVELVDFPGEEVQLEVYNDAVERHKVDTYYMAFIDADEFIVPMEDEKNIWQIIDEIFDEYLQRKYCFSHTGTMCGGIGINWKVFGTSGYKNKPDGLVTEHFVYRAKDDDETNCRIKSICNPRRIDKFDYSPHIPAYIEKYVEITENGSYLFNSPFFCDAHYNRLQINHYMTKSESEYIAKIKRGYPDQKHFEIRPEIIENKLNSIDNLNAVYDSVMLKYTEQIKSRC